MYTYYVHDLPASFNPNQPGNYIYTKLVNGYWVPIYIGQGDLGVRVSDSHHKAACIRSKGATHVHVHLNSSEQSRLAEERDLLGRFTQAYVPTGCNDTIGG